MWLQVPTKLIKRLLSRDYLGSSDGFPLGDLIVGKWVLLIGVYMYNLLLAVLYARRRAQRDELFDTVQIYISAIQ